MYKAILFVFLPLLSFGQTKWTVDKSHSEIGFIVTHMLISEVDGEFHDYDLQMTSPNDDFSNASIVFTIKVSSIDTDNSRRDDHLKSGDFFDESKFPEIKFAGRLVKENDDYFLEGDFTMKEVTEKVKFDVTYMGSIETKRGKKAGFKVTGTLNRFDYGLKWNSTVESGGLVVGEDVVINCKLELNEEK
ncbi:MAG: YceI family protein [Cyclobacteriaceae bacterium]|nr:YceI family protein [Cyclobacteriaceae bacterium]